MADSNVAAKVGSAAALGAGAAVLALTMFSVTVPTPVLRSAVISSPSNTRGVGITFKARILSYDSLTDHTQAHIIPPAVRANYTIQWVATDEDGHNLTILPRVLVHDSFIEVTPETTGSIKLAFRERENAAAPWVSACGIWAIPNQGLDGQRPCPTPVPTPTPSPTPSPTPCPCPCK